MRGKIILFVISKWFIGWCAPLLYRGMVKHVKLGNEARASSRNEARAPSRKKARASSRNEARASSRNEARASSRNKARASANQKRHYVIKSML